MRTPRILVETSRFPLVVNRMCKGFDDSDVEAMIKQFELLFHGNRRYGLLVYCDPDSIMTARQRRRVADWYKERQDIVSRVNVAAAIVIESALIRGGMTAFNWLMEPKYTQRYVATIHEGVNFLIEALEKANVTVPLEVMALRDVPERKLKQLA